MELQLNMETDTVKATASEHRVCVAPETTIREIFARLKENNSGSALVLRDGKLSGIFTERDALKLMAIGGDLDTPVSELMTKTPVSLRDGDTIATAVRKMSTGGYRRLPVVDDKGCPTGVLKATSILRYLVEHFPQTIYNLPPDPDNASKHREAPNRAAPPCAAVASHLMRCE